MKKYYVLLALSAMLLSGCGGTGGYTPKISYEIKYEVTGTTIDASLTIENESGGTSQYSAAVLPWTKSFTLDTKYHFLYVSAQNNYSTGDVTASIFVDGVLYKTSTSSGAYVIATASGSVGSY
jgi:hypothetical protein